MNIRQMLRVVDEKAYASSRVFSNSKEANDFLKSNPEYRVVPNKQGSPSSQVTLALGNDEGFDI